MLLSILLPDLQCSDTMRDHRVGCWSSKGLRLQDREASCWCTQGGLLVSDHGNNHRSPETNVSRRWWGRNTPPLLCPLIWEKQLHGVWKRSSAMEIQPCTLGQRDVMLSARGRKIKLTRNRQVFLMGIWLPFQKTTGEYLLIFPHYVNYHWTAHFTSISFHFSENRNKTVFGQLDLRKQLKKALSSENGCTMSCILTATF